MTNKEVLIILSNAKDLGSRLIGSEPGFDKGLCALISRAAKEYFGESVWLTNYGISEDIPLFNFSLAYSKFKAKSGIYWWIRGDPNREKFLDYLISIYEKRVANE